VSPISREREYARRRYEKWQSKQAVKMAKQARQRRVAIVSAAGVLVVLVIAGLALAFTGGSSDDATTATEASPEVSASASADASSSAAASPSASASAAAGPNPCPAPTVKPPASPQSFSKVPDKGLAQGKSWTFTLTTSCGDIVADLDGAKAPQAVSNAVFLSGKGFWNGSPCHRLGAEGLYMLQCGDPTGTGSGGPGYEFGPIENAPADNIYKAGTLAMARTQDPNTQGSQFFLVFKDTQLGDGYTVFGHITKGLDVLTKVAAGGVATPGADGSGPPARAISIVKTTVTPG
jgi:peptidyl-prolyl cis-trans isomerase B (cyclophilin B)